MKRAVAQDYARVVVVKCECLISVLAWKKQNAAGSIVLTNHRTMQPLFQEIAYMANSDFFIGILRPAVKLTIFCQR